MLCGQGCECYEVDCVSTSGLTSLTSYMASVKMCLRAETRAHHPLAMSCTIWIHHTRCVSAHREMAVHAISAGEWIPPSYGVQDGTAHPEMG